MAMNVDDFKKLVETLDIPADIKSKVLEATKDENVVPYEWDNKTHLGAEIENPYGNKYILYAVDDSIDFFGIPLSLEGRPLGSDGSCINRSEANKFTGRKAIMVDTRLPESVDDIEVGELFTAKVDGEDVIVQRRNDTALLWNVIVPSSHVYPEADHNVQLIHRLVEVK